LDPARHLAGRLVREGDGEDMLRGHPADAEEPGDPVGDDPRLAAAGAREHEEGPVARRHRLALRRVQVDEERLAVEHLAIVPCATIRPSPTWPGCAAGP